MIGPIVAKPPRIAGEKFSAPYGSVVAQVPRFDVVAERPGHGTTGFPINIMVNCFKMNIPTNVIYHYDGKQSIWNQYRRHF